MAKNKHKDKDRSRTSSSSSKTTANADKPSKTTANVDPKTIANANKPESVQSGKMHTDPKAAPQAPSGPVPQPVGTGAVNTKTTSAGSSGEKFVIPKADKRARSQSSRGSEGSHAAPPPKKSYAETAKNTEAKKDVTELWPELQLRIYKTNLYHKKISYDEFLEVRRKVFNHSISYLNSHPDQVDTIKTISVYYNKVLKCGVFNCYHEQALAWFKTATTTVCGEEYKGWTKNEKVTTVVKIFVPPGFEDTSAVDYLGAIRIMYETETTKGIPWEVIKFYIHHTKHTHIIIATIPTVIFLQIKAQGVETSKGSGVWKSEGFLAPLKLTLANGNDLRGRNPQASRPKPATPTTPTTPIMPTSPSPKPQTSPKPSTSSKSSTPPPPPPPPPPMPKVKLATNLTSSLFKPDKDDPFLSSSAMTPSGEDMDHDHDQDLEDVDDVEEVEVEMEGEEQEMDLNLLNPDPEEDFCGSWAEEV